MSEPSPVTMYCSPCLSFNSIISTNAFIQIHIHRHSQPVDFPSLQNHMMVFLIDIPDLVTLHQESYFTTRLVESRPSSYTRVSGHVPMSLDKSARGTLAIFGLGQKSPSIYLNRIIRLLHDLLPCAKNIINDSTS